MRDIALVDYVPKDIVCSMATISPECLQALLNTCKLLKKLGKVYHRTNDIFFIFEKKYLCNICIFLTLTQE